MAGFRGLQRDRLPGTVDDARTMVAYNERILATSTSPQRRQRAERMLANLRPLLAQREIRRIEQVAAAASFEGQLPRFCDRRAIDDEFEVKWNGAMKTPLTAGVGLGSSLAPGAGGLLL